MVDQVSRTFQSRLQSEQQASSSRTTRNHLVVPALIDLLDEKKLVKTSNGLKQLAEKYNFDLEKLQCVTRYVNSPSIDAESVLRIVNDDGSERTTMKVRPLFIMYPCRRAQRDVFDAQAIWVDSRAV